MVTDIHAFSHPVEDKDGVSYRVHAEGEKQADGLWRGRLRFESELGGGPRWTGWETTQSKADALTYWATGLEPVYLEGALERAKPEP